MFRKTFSLYAVALSAVVTTVMDPSCMVNAVTVIETVTDFETLKRGMENCSTYQKPYDTYIATITESFAWPSAVAIGYECNLTLQGDVGIVLDASAEPSNRFFFASTQVVNIIGLTFKGAESSFAQGGGAMFIFGSASLTVDSTTFENNSAGSAGGALVVDTGGTMTLKSATFTGNSCTEKEGGAIAVTGGGILSLESCTFSSNTAFRDGNDIAVLPRTGETGQMAIKCGPMMISDLYIGVGSVLNFGVCNNGSPVYTSSGTTVADVVSSTDWDGSAFSSELLVAAPTCANSPSCASCYTGYNLSAQSCVTCSSEPPKGQGYTSAGSCVTTACTNVVSVGQEYLAGSNLASSCASGACSSEPPKGQGYTSAGSCMTSVCTNSISTGREYLAGRNLASSCASEACANEPLQGQGYTSAGSCSLSACTNERNLGTECECVEYAVGVALASECELSCLPDNSREGSCADQPGTGSGVRSTARTEIMGLFTTFIVTVVCYSSSW